MNKKNTRELLKEHRIKAKEIAISNISDEETIPYTEPYRNTFIKKDEIYRKKAKKKAIKTLVTCNVTFSDAETIPYVDDNLSDTETIQYVEPYRGMFTKKDEIYRAKTKKKYLGKEKGLEYQ